MKLLPDLRKSIFIVLKVALHAVFVLDQLGEEAVCFHSHELVLWLTFFTRCESLKDLSGKGPVFGPVFLVLLSPARILESALPSLVTKKHDQVCDRLGSYLGVLTASGVGFFIIFVIYFKLVFFFVFLALLVVAIVEIYESHQTKLILRAV